MDIFELTVPLEANIKNANARKMNKYEHFITDITTRDVSVHPFEIGSRGYISPSNNENLKELHKFCKPSVKFLQSYVRKSIKPCCTVIIPHF